MQGAGAPLPAAAPAANRATLIIHVPKRVARSSSKSRRPRYISPSTKSASIAIAPAAGCKGCSPALAMDIGLTPSSAGCTPVANGTTCTLSFDLHPGTYAGAISTYDGAAGCQTSSACNALSSNQAFPLTIAAGKANQLAVTLYGVPAKLVVMPVTNNVAIVGLGVFVGGVNATAQVSLYAADADGNLILGPGTPAFALPAQPANGWSASLKGNVLQFVTASTYGQTTFTEFGVNLTSPSCSLTGAACALELFPNIQPQIALADSAGNAVHLYLTNRTTGALTTYATVTNGVSQPIDAKFDGLGKLYVANAGSATVNVYNPPYSGAPAASINVGNAPTMLAVDPNGDVAVAENFFGNESVTVFNAPGYTTSQTIPISSPHIVAAMAFAWADDSLWIAVNNGLVANYPAGSASPGTQLGLDRPTAIDVDKKGDLYVAGDGAQETLTEYDSPGFAAGTSITLPSTASSMVNIDTAAAVCSSSGAALYSSALQLQSAIGTSGGNPCTIAADYFDDDYWLQAPYSASSSQLYGPGTSALLPFLAKSIAAFPGPDAQY
jgi:hypothetical protein